MAIERLILDQRFAVRGDPNDRSARYAKESTFFHSLQWFGEYL
jgi:hypothetical protein